MAMMRVSKLLLLVAVAPASVASEDVFKLKFLGDYQTGNWNEDAAESLAYDKYTHRAFVASAQAGEVDVVDLSEPSKPTFNYKLRVIKDMENSCTMKTCIYEYMEFGGTANPCGSAPLVALIHSAHDIEVPAGFNTSTQKYEVDPTMRSPESCQAKCVAEAWCTHFSYERMYSNHMCYLKYEYMYIEGIEGILAAKGLTLASCSMGTGGYALYPGMHGPEWKMSPGSMWYGASGPKTCLKFYGSSLQAVAVVPVPGMHESVVVVAAQAANEFGNGYLALYSAKDLKWIGCDEAGSKPEGITTNGGGKVAVFNKGSASKDGTLDFKGSMTLCDITGGPHINCDTYIPNEKNFAKGQYLKAFQFRNQDVRLYGPNGDHPDYDLEPEGGTFTADGKYLMVNMQKNNAFLLFDLHYKKYTGMHGWGTKEMKMDSTPLDYRVNIKDRWGVEEWAKVPAYGLYMPDQITNFMINDEYYFITANEGALRDDLNEGMLGESGNFKGESVRMADTDACTCKDCCQTDQLGRLLTTIYQPSDFATKACGSNVCDVKELATGLNSNFECVYEDKDYGGGPMSVLQGQPDNFCDNPILMQIVVAQNGLPNYTWPDWAPVNHSIVDPNMTSWRACKIHCMGMVRCEYWSYEYMEGYHICYMKDYTDDPCQIYYEWNKRHLYKDWKGFTGPKICTYPKATYTTTRALSNDGSPGGAYAIGGRSFSIFKWKGPYTYLMERVFDSDDKMEVETFKVNNGLCDGCDDSANQLRCATTCPFNSDAAPPKMDGRSSEKGPEPEAVTIGKMEDGTMLAFVGLERTGGIMTYDVTNPMDAKFQDFLNVRNWMVNDAGREMQKHALNDGPETLVFVPAEDSPLGRELLLAGSPLAGRLTLYVIEKGELRGNDGSCKDTATCPYIAQALGGTGTAREVKVCDECKGPACETLGCGPYIAPGTGSTAKKTEDDDDEIKTKWFILVVAVTAGVCIILAIVAFIVGKCLGSKDKSQANGAANQPPAWQQPAASAPRPEPKPEPRTDAVTAYKANNPGLCQGNVLTV